MASSRKSPSINASALDAVVASCLSRYVCSGQHIVVTFSGGIDSTVLLGACAARLRDSPQIGKLSALHVHHGISPHADRWEAFCRDSCSRLDVPFTSVRVDVERASHDGLEAAARRVRHAVFAAAEGDWLLLAQHRDDQAETLLFNLLRGAGVTGAAAMRERNGRLLRPLLSIGREEIEIYARRHGLEWIEDESNADTRYSRNFLRRKIMPELQGRFPAATRTLAAAASRFAEARDLLDDLARLDLGTVADFPLDIAVLRGLEGARARNVLRYLLTRHHVMIPSEARLQEALRQLCEAGHDRHPAQYFGAHCLLRQGNRVYLESVGT